VCLLLDKVKRNNIKNILSIMLSQGANTKANISFLTGLSNTTVSDCINEVQAINFVSKTGFEKPKGGRRSAIYTINKDYGMFLGITILKDSIFFTLTDSCGNIINSFFYDKGNQTPILSIYNGIEKACEIGTILAIGIGVYGIVDYINQTLISSVYDNWSNVPLKELIERRYRIVTYLDHTSNHLAVWEKNMGIGQNYNNFLWASEKLGSDKLGVVLNGTVLRGLKNMCGQTTKCVEHNTKEAYMAKLQELGQFLDVECIILDTDNAVTSQASDNNIPIHMVNTSPAEMSAAAAVAVELEWFLSILRRVE